MTGLLMRTFRRIVDDLMVASSIDCAADALPCPDKAHIRTALDHLWALLFPARHPRYSVARILERHCAALYKLLSGEIAKSLRHTASHPDDVLPLKQALKEGQRLALDLLGALAHIKQALEKDAAAAYRGDPAAASISEIRLSYPGFRAIVVHRLANFLYTRGVPLIPRMMSEEIHSETGIDIHPGATIGDSFFIDHGTGVVVGETTVIGARVKLYQGVTLGALSIPHRDTGGRERRHPLIEDDVTIYAGATILGAESVIGQGSIVGGNVWLTQAVPPHTKVINKAPFLIYEDLKTGKEIKKEEVFDTDI